MILRERKFRSGVHQQYYQVRRGGQLVRANLQIRPNKEVDLGALREFKMLIDNLFLKGWTPKSVFLWRLGSIRFQKNASLPAYKGIFPKYIAPR